jgi:hypothetical protein
MWTSGESAEVNRASPKPPKFFPTLCICRQLPTMADMAVLPAHPPQMEDDTDEELTDEQVQELLAEAAERMRAKAPQPINDAPFKLPKLNPGYIAETYSTTQGAITRLDSSKLLPKKEQALANGTKKIEDPVQLKKQKKEVSCNAFIPLALDDNYPISY